MISLSIPEGLKARDVVVSAVLVLAVLLLPSDRCFQGSNMDWLGGLILFPVMLVAGLLSSWLYHGRHDATSIDPFYIRAWWSFIGGSVGLPACLLFRPSVAPIAFTILTFGAGPVAGFHIWRRITGRQRG